jgi:hypothetical protein
MENKETKANDPIHNVINSKKDYSDDNIYKSNGLTKREYFAAMALQGLLANDSALITSKARDAVQAADALIEILNKAKYDD